MFNLSTQEVVSSIEKTPLVNLDGIYFQEYHNFFGKNFSLPATSGLQTSTLEFQEHLPRVRLDYSNTLCKILRIKFMDTRITKALSKKFNQDLKFDSCDIWVDSKGYNLKPHIDDQRIKLAIQIYLSEKNIGTSLYNGVRKIKTFEFKVGSGYALLNTEKSLHGLDSPVEQDGRVSLYARYS